MASISTDPNGNRTIQFVAGDGKRRSIRLGKMPIRQAEALKVRVEALNAAKVSGLPLDGETAAWVARIGDDLAAKLAAVGLIAGRAVATLGEFTRDYIDGRTDIKPRTRTNLEQSRRTLVDFFGAQKELRSITEHDADRWAIDLKQRYAEATAARTVKHARQFFKAGTRARLVTSNPFAGVKCGSMSNDDRLYFVTRDATEKLIGACPDPDWRAIVALSRYGGLRCPSEHLALTWADIDWERERFLVRSSKTEHTKTKGKRWVPLFPELKPFLDALFAAAPEGTVHVINRYRDPSQNLRTTFDKIVDRAGLLPWPRPFQNLRASHETELAARFPLHVVVQWIGNSAPVAAKHYLQVTDADFARAVGKGGADSGALALQNPVQSTAVGERQELNATPETKTPQELSRPVASPDTFCPSVQVPPRGVEPLF
jgi:integrase